MLHIPAYDSLGGLLRDACVQFKADDALVEYNRKRETGRLSFLRFKEESMTVAGLLERHQIGASGRVAILMSNQSKWLIGAHAALYRGATLVPLDYKLTAEEQLALLDHCAPDALVVEYPIWRKLVRARGDLPVPLVLVTEAPPSEALEGATRWESIEPPTATPVFIPRGRQDIATIVYSSGTGGQAKGCMLSHGAYLEQADSLVSLFPMKRGERYLSILPTNHAIDFMCGFIVPFVCGAMVVHQRTLRPEFITETMKRAKVTHMALVPLVLTAFERAIREKLDALSPVASRVFEGLKAVNSSMTVKAPKLTLSRALLRPVHDAFGGHLKFLFCGGAFVDRRRAEFFYQLGIPVVIGYGLTEACTVATVHDLKPFRADSVGLPAPGVEIRIDTPNAQGIGQVLISGPTLMSGYLDAPELTAETLIDGWLHTGDLGRLDASGHLHLVGRSKNMIVTEGGKNVYPEDIEGTFDDLPCEELAVFATNYIWPKEGLTGEQLLAVVRCRADTSLTGLLARLTERNRKLPDFKRVGGVLAVEDAFPRTASMKVKRAALADRLRRSHDRSLIQAL